LEKAFSWTFVRTFLAHELTRRLGFQKAIEAAVAVRGEELFSQE